MFPETRHVYHRDLGSMRFWHHGSIGSFLFSPATHPTSHGTKGLIEANTVPSSTSMAEAASCNWEIGAKRKLQHFELHSKGSGRYSWWYHQSSSSWQPHPFGWEEDRAQTNKWWQVVKADWNAEWWENMVNCKRHVAAIFSRAVQLSL